MKKRKIPLRKCLGCTEMKPKKELIRVVHNADGEVHVDRKGKAHGRGAYICNDIECFHKARKTKAFNRAFETDIPESIYDELIKELDSSGTTN